MYSLVELKIEFIPSNYLMKNYKSKQCIREPENKEANLKNRKKEKKNK